ncbi:MAG: MarR family winged helix-turn-helix transcriptional regulator [Usitatibacteraceae bacterium]
MKTTPEEKLNLPTPLNCTCGRLRKLTRRMTSFYEQHMREVGLKLSQYSVLANLSAEQQSLAQLAARLDMDRTTLTRSLKPLVEHGWVSEVAGVDARQRLLVLTPEGKDFRQRAHAHWRQAQLALETHLGRNVVADLNTQLETLLTQLRPLLPEEN